MKVRYRNKESDAFLQLCNPFLVEVYGGRFLYQRGLPLINDQRLADQPEAFFLAARDIYLSCKQIL
jgi:hypothetical protein